MRRLIAALMLAVATPAAASSPPPAFATAPLAVGASWYPEQWPEDRWEADLALMEKAHLSVVRIGEFAWARMEPADGRCDFGWLDRAIAAAATAAVVLAVAGSTLLALAAGAWAFVAVARLTGNDDAGGEDAG